MADKLTRAGMKLKAAKELCDGVASGGGSGGDASLGGDDDVGGGSVVMVLLVVVIAASMVKAGLKYIEEIKIATSDNWL